MTEQPPLITGAPTIDRLVVALEQHGLTGADLVAHLEMYVARGTLSRLDRLGLDGLPPEARTVWFTTRYGTAVGRVARIAYEAGIGGG